MNDTYTRLSFDGRGGNFVQLITGKRRRKNANHQTTQCRSCSGFFTSKGKGQIFCSRACWQISIKPKSVSLPDCQQCGIAFKPVKNTLGIYCSKRCWGAKRSDDALNRTASSLKIPKQEFRECRVCRKEFNATNTKQQCSKECAKAFARIAAQEKARALHAQDAKTVSCNECLALFSPLYGSSHASLCTPCADGRDRAYKSARRAMRKAMESRAKIEVVDPHKVFARDGWHCRICGVNTPLSLRGTYADSAPELDHIRPLSKGGEHSYRNTQCACRKCNALKSDAWAEADYGFAFDGDSEGRAAWKSALLLTVNRYDPLFP